MQTIRVNNSFDIPSSFTGITEFPDGKKSWWRNGKLHREDGLAVGRSDGFKEYWYRGKQYENLEEVKQVHLQRISNPNE